MENATLIIVPISRVYISKTNDRVSARSKRHVATCIPEPEIAISTDQRALLLKLFEALTHVNPGLFNFFFQRAKQELCQYLLIMMNLIKMF